MTDNKDFTILFHPKNRQEMELGRQLLEEAGIPVVVDASDRVEMLEVLQGSSAEGIMMIAVPKDRFDEATGLIEDAWGPEALSDR